MNGWSPVIEVCSRGSDGTDRRPFLGYKSVVLGYCSSPYLSVYCTHLLSQLSTQSAIDIRNSIIMSNNGLLQNAFAGSSNTLVDPTGMTREEAPYDMMESQKPSDSAKSERTK